ncbi:hypothetical protein GCM10023091_16090 [Ravibacter arvi]|uniref:Polygalacturonase n=1 Tax=Ravibacter arvi TaxID=2051041 RepID=A0ABP8LUF9_9BACT
MQKIWWTVFTVLFSWGMVKGGESSESLEITPNAFQGTDTQRIRQAVEKASRTTHIIRIPAENANGSSVWMIDDAILLPSNIRVILDNCTLQLSDQSRDNMFRSDNVGDGIENPGWNRDIHLVGMGRVILRGAANPRSTGDGARKLTLDPVASQKKGIGRVSYGSDAAFPDRKQTGDWRNIMVLIAKVDGFSLTNVRIEHSHAWAVSFERTLNARISDIQIHNPEEIAIGNRKVKVYNKDGINLRQGCKYFRINNIDGINGDDLVALSSLDVQPALTRVNGTLFSTMVTRSGWYGPEDDIEQVFITNCQTNYTGVAIRASDSASVHHVYVNGVITKARPDTPPPYGGSPYTLLVGGKGYGAPSQPGKINNIYAFNLMGDGKNLVLIEAPVENCRFVNGIYTGIAPQPVTFNVPVTDTKGVSVENFMKMP